MTPETLKRASDFHQGFDDANWWRDDVPGWFKSIIITVATIILLIIAAAYFGVGLAGPLPSAYFEYCKKQECAAEPVTIAYTAEFQNLIEMARVEQRYAVTWTADPEGTDTWSYPSEGVGDCEDIAIWFMHYLQSKGIPKGTMRFAVGYAWGGRHAWVMIHTSRGWYALDTSDFAFVDEFHAQAEYVETFDCIPNTGCGWRGNVIYPSRTSVVAHTEDRE